MVLGKTIRILPVLVVCVCLWASPVFAQLAVTTVLLPDEDTVLLPEEDFSEPKRPDNKMLRIAADGSSPIKATSIAKLRFNLESIPVDAHIIRVTLHLEGEPAISNPQLVRIFDNHAGTGKSLGKWTAISGKTIFTVTSEALRQVVAGARAARKPLFLFLLSTSRLSDWHYYSTQSYGGNTSSKPRMIVAFNLDMPPAVTSEITAWRFCKETERFKVKPFHADEAILSNPVFYNGNAFLFAKPDDTHTNLYALHLNGRERWRRTIAQTPAKYARVNYGGTLYSIGRERVARYDLKNHGVPGAVTTIANLKLSIPPTLGADSSLYFVLLGNAYGLNPEMKELWRYPLKAKGSVFSPIVLAPPAQASGYVAARIQDQSRLTVLDTAVGGKIDYPLDSKYTAFHTPVVIPASGSLPEYVFLAANSNTDGLLACYAGNNRIWSQVGPVSQPVATADGKRLFAVQKAQLKAYDPLNGKVLAASNRKDLAATSNLVLDGDSNVYFWNNGTFFKFDRQCRLVASQKLPDLAERLELIFAPGGTLFARNPNTRQLVQVLPTLEKLTVRPDNLQNNTVYSADTVRLASNQQLASNVAIAVKARDRISIGRGFTVKKGAQLTCKTGY
jgi:hypothetical protein